MENLLLVITVNCLTLLFFSYCLFHINMNKERFESNYPFLFSYIFDFYKYSVIFLLCLLLLFSSVFIYRIF